jgi:hypothetical protein
MDWALTVIKERGSSAALEQQIATVSEIFDLTDTAQLERAEERCWARVNRLRAGEAPLTRAGDSSMSGWD